MAFPLLGNPFPEFRLILLVSSCCTCISDTSPRNQEFRVEVLRFGRCTGPQLGKSAIFGRVKDQILVKIVILIKILLMIK